MSLLEKSKDNRAAFDFLWNQQGFSTERNLYTSAMHCAYYSVYQRMHVIFREFFKPEYNRLNEYFENEENKRPKSHNKYIKEFAYYYKSKLSIDDGKEIDDCLTQLKSLRHKSDYENELITETQALKAKTYLEKVHKLMDKTEVK